MATAVKKTDAHTPSILSFDDVSFSYGNLEIIEKVSFDIEEGESFCIVGPNGGGKTTLLKLALGLLEPSKGSIKVCGLVPQEARMRVGYVSQQLNYDPLFPMTVLEVVLMGRLGQSPFGFYNKADKEAAHEALEWLGIVSIAEQPFAKLSGGQRQRALIARALVCKPSLLLLDEPTAHVDPSAESQFRELLHELYKKMTIVTVSHDLGFVSSQVKKVVCINRRAEIHSTDALTSDVFKELYSSDHRMVHHGHCGHSH